MPQMAPLMWLTLFFIFFITFMLFNIMNYYSYFPLNLSHQNNCKYISSMNWKW